MAASVRTLLPSAEARGNPIREAWDRLEGLPGGTRLFSRMVGLMAPYTGTIGAHVVELRRGYARVTLRDRRAVRNHLRSVHAVALVNLAELCGNVAVAYTLPDDARFIVAGLSIDYLKKARGTVTAESHCPLFASAEREEHAIEVVLRDAGGDDVAKAVLKTLVGPKKDG